MLNKTLDGKHTLTCDPGSFSKVRCTAFTQRPMQVYKCVSTDNIARNAAKLLTDPSVVLK